MLSKGPRRNYDKLSKKWSKANLSSKSIAGLKMPHAIKRLTRKKSELKWNYIQERKKPKNSNRKNCYIESRSLPLQYQRENYNKF